MTVIANRRAAACIIRIAVLGLVAPILGCAAPDRLPRPATNLERYAELLWLRDNAFACLQATRRGGTSLPRVTHMLHATSAMQREIRSELVRREGEAAVAGVEQADDSDVGHVRCGSTGIRFSDQARERYRNALFAMQRRLGLPLGSRQSNQ